MHELRIQCLEAKALGMTKIELSLDVVINVLDRIDNINALIERQTALLEKLKVSINQ